MREGGLIIISPPDNCMEFITKFMDLFMFLLDLSTTNPLFSYCWYLVITCFIFVIVWSIFKWI